MIRFSLLRWFLFPVLTPWVLAVCRNLPFNLFLSPFSHSPWVFTASLRIGTPIHIWRWQIQSMVLPRADITRGAQRSSPNSLVLVGTVLQAGLPIDRPQHSGRKLFLWPTCQRLPKSLSGALEFSDPLCSPPPPAFVDVYHPASGVAHALSKCFV